jgi:hypothetical protein
MFFQKNTSMPKPETAQELYEQILFHSHDRIITIPYFTAKKNGTCSKSLGPTSFLLKVSRSMSSKKARKARQRKLLAQVEYLEAWQNEASFSVGTMNLATPHSTFDTNNNPRINTSNKNDDMIAGHNTVAMYMPWDTDQVLSYNQPCMSHQLPPTKKAGRAQRQQQEQQQQSFVPYSNMGIMI